MSLRNTLIPVSQKTPINQTKIETCLCRRSILVGCAALILTPSSFLGCAQKEDQKRGLISLGSFNSLKEGRTIFSIERIALFREGASLSAMSMNCTHQSCFLHSIDDIKPGGYECPCHGSVFDSSGKVVSGPATKDLPHYGVTITNGEIIVNLGKEIL